MKVLGGVCGMGRTGQALKYNSSWHLNKTKQFMLRRGRIKCIHKQWAWIFRCEG